MLRCCMAAFLGANISELKTHNKVKVQNQIYALQQILEIQQPRYPKCTNTHQNNPQKLSCQCIILGVRKTISILLYFP